MSIVAFRVNDFFIAASVEWTRFRHVVSLLLLFGCVVHVRALMFLDIADYTVAVGLYEVRFAIECKSNDLENDICSIVLY
jgi:hypothetical protein